MLAAFQMGFQVVPPSVLASSVKVVPLLLSVS